MRRFPYCACLALSLSACTAEPGQGTAAKIDEDAASASGTAATSGTVIPSGSAGGAPSSGTAGGPTGTASGVVSSGAAIGAGSGGTSSGGAASGATGAAGSGGASTSDSGVASGAPGDSGPPDESRPDGASASAFPSGPSAGCGNAPPSGVTSAKFALQDIAIPSCGSGPVTPKCVAPPFAPGGSAYLKVDAYDFNNRNYGVELPPNYDPAKPYPLILEGNGCTGGPTTLGGGFSAGETNAIRVGLSYVGQCFADGGVQCSVTPDNVPICVNNPEVPYVSAVLADVESKVCVNLGKVFMGGQSSGAWESSTVGGCALANVIRGTVMEFGGLRIHRAACTGPSATLLLVAGADASNPVGPMMMDMPYSPAALTAAQVDTLIADLDSYGSAPERDELLARNGCVGTETAPYDPNYPQCVTYTGCPAAYPVVWCFLPNVGHATSTYMGRNYVPGSTSDPLFWSFLTKLPSP